MSFQVICENSNFSIPFESSECHHEEGEEEEEEEEEAVSNLDAYKKKIHNECAYVQTYVERNLFTMPYKTSKVIVSDLVTISPSSSYTFEDEESLSSLSGHIPSSKKQ